MITRLVPRLAGYPHFQRRPVLSSFDASAVLKHRPICYIGWMTRDQVKEILDRVLTWPPERQADLAHVVQEMEEYDSSDLRLSDEQAAEVRRRIADPDRKSIPAEDVFKRYRSSGA